MQKFIDQIVEKKDSIDEFIDELTLPGGGYPLVMYGKGPYAKMVYEGLKPYFNKLNLVAITGDKEFIKEGAEFEGRKIEDLAEVVKRYEKVNIIIAFGIYRDVPQEKLGQWLEITSDRLKALSTSVNKVVYYDFFWKYSYDFIKKHEQILQDVYERLEDQKSKDVMVAFFNQRISGNADYIPKVCSGNIYLDSDIIKLEQEEIYIDCGAYNGDSVIPFIKKIESLDGECSYKKIIAFEADLENVEKFKRNVMGKFKNVEIIPKATYSTVTKLKFDNGNLTSSCLSEDGMITVETENIDHILDDGEERVSFIKLDVEGAELETLKGARKSIANYKPKLAISIYHKQEDLVTIPQFLLDLVPEYKLYMRAHVGDSSDVVLYAVI